MDRSSPLPGGVEPEGLAVSVHGGNLILTGAKPRPSLDHRSAFLTEERSYGPFRRVIQLGVPVNTRQAEAVLTGFENLVAAWPDAADEKLIAAATVRRRRRASIGVATGD